MCNSGQSKARSLFFFLIFLRIYFNVINNRQWKTAVRHCNKILSKIFFLSNHFECVQEKGWFNWINSMKTHSENESPAAPEIKLSEFLSTFCHRQIWDFFLGTFVVLDVLWLTRSLASIFCPPRNQSTTMPSYDSSHSKVAVSPAVTVTSFRGCSSPMDRAEEEEEDMFRGMAGLRLFSVRKPVEQQKVMSLSLQSEGSSNFR